MRKRIYKIYVAVSAIILIVSAGLWAMSYLYETRLSFTWNNHDYLIASLRGSVLIQANWNVGVGPAYWIENTPQSPIRLTGPGYEQNMDLQLAGFGYGRRRGWGFMMGGFGPWSHESFVAPYWLAVLLTSVPVLHRLVNQRRHVEPGCCRACGYNLVGTTGKRCPECGETIMRKPRIANTA